jgi:multiple sugar transport system permease protein
LAIAIAMLAPAIVALALFKLAPLASALLGSVQHTRFNVVTDSFVGLANYATAFASPDFLNSLGVTLLFTLVVNPVQIAIALGLAVLFTRGLRGSGLARTLMILPVAVPGAVACLIWGLALRPDGSVNALLAGIGVGSQPFLTDASQALPTLVLIASWIGIGYWTVFLVAGLYEIPVQYEEAASVDGAGFRQTFWHVTLPLLRRTLLFVLVADTVANFLLFTPVQVLTKGGPNGSTDVLMYEIYRQSYVLIDPNTALPEIVLLMVVTILVVAVEFRLLSRAGS